MDISDQHIGRRLREVRSWRQLNLTTVAGLAGMTPSYLSLIERGLRPVTKRTVLEALAAALRVAPTELIGKPYPPSDELTSDAHATLAGLEIALDAYDLGIDPGVPPRPWRDVERDVRHMNEVLRTEADYAVRGAAVPGLLADLHAAYVRHPEHRAAVLISLIYAYYEALSISKNLGAAGLPLLAARLAQSCAEDLGAPEWLAFAAWLRSYAGGPQGRAHQYTLSTRAIDRLTPHLDDPNSVQAAGMLHLTAALAAAVQGQVDVTGEHLAEADALASALPAQHENFGYLFFGQENVRLWRVSIATELGEGGKVAEIARGAHPETLPRRSWEGTFWADLGRSLAMEAKTRDQGIQYLMKAESIAPQVVRNNVFVREAVSDLLRRSQREAGGRELRGLAYRLGVAPTG